MAVQPARPRTHMRTIGILMLVLVLGAFAIMFLTPPRTPEGQAQMARVAETTAEEGRSAATDTVVAGAPVTSSVAATIVGARNEARAGADNPTEAD